MKKNVPSPKKHRYGTHLVIRIFLSVLLVCIAADIKDSAPAQAEQVRKVLCESTDLTAAWDAVTAFLHSSHILQR